MPADDNDWRLQGQEKYLKGAVLSRRPYRKPRPDWDHDHCAFCSAKFMEEPGPEILTEGYCTPDEYHWICSKCFEDFKDRFGWIAPSPKPIPDDRPLTPHETDLVRWLLEHGGDEARFFLPQLDGLRVVTRCGCGCASIEFIPDALGAIHVLSDYQWRAASRNLFGVFVFAKRRMLAGLEVWSIDGNATPTTLPDPASLDPVGTPET